MCVPSENYILLVEDEAITLLLLEGILTDAGWRVLGFTTGEEALAMAQADPPSLAVVDLHLAGQLDGVALLKRLQALTQPALPVVVVTGYSAEASLRQDLARIVGDSSISIVAKPFDADVFLSEVRAQFQRRPPVSSTVRCVMGDAAAGANSNEADEGFEGASRKGVA